MSARLFAEPEPAPPIGPRPGEPWLVCQVYGDPVPQGSKRAVQHRTTGRTMMLAANHRSLAPWRQEVARTVLAELERLGRTGQLLKGPVRLVLDFRVPARASYGKRPKLKHAAVRPDLDKLKRAICDALTGTVYRDDGQVTSALCTKRVAQPGELTGVLIEVRPDDDVRPSGW